MTSGGISDSSWGGTAGGRFDPCYHEACDTIDNVDLHALEVNSDLIAFAQPTFAYSTESVNGVPGKVEPAAPAGPSRHLPDDHGVRRGDQQRNGLPALRPWKDAGREQDRHDDGAVSGAMFALGLAQLGMVLRDRTREPAARRFYRGATRVALVVRLRSDVAVPGGQEHHVGDER